ncbi:hypothetical protein AUC71_01495 [Methyloceanibacter marginalis]|uniref:Uncharacterized protein n=1 Tax=Methyloceanibacter marginalis TaxID=1774971 RepID=A0A1E3W9V0_9HYPH|nr:hypothetical protein [Methyloceanibacter marginalis]ODS02605.1 hypothetical protein AUC71_01495 [Methyloceanibacter marginalis]
MLYVDVPTSKEVAALNLVRSDACISIYLKTTPLTQEIRDSQITLGNLAKSAIGQLEGAGLEKRRIWPLQENFDSLLEDDAFWKHQAHSLAILATPDLMRTYRLANKLTDMVKVSDRFHLKPLLRAITFPHAAHVLAISENAVRLVEISSDLPATELRVPNMPRDAASAVGKSTINDSGTGRRLEGLQGQKVRLGQYVRKIDAALRPILMHSDIPVVLAATLPVESLFRSLSALPLLPQTIEGSPDHLTDAELAKAARPVLDGYYKSQIEDFHRLFEQRAGQNRVTTDISDAARAATFGGIESLLVDIDSITDGFVDDRTGAVTFASEGDADNYGIVDEIAGRAMRSGAHVFAVRKADIPADKELAAILRYPI